METIVRILIDLYFGFSISLAFFSRRQILYTVAEFQSRTDQPLSYRRYFNIAAFTWIILFSPIYLAITVFKIFASLGVSK